MDHSFIITRSPKQTWDELKSRLWVAMKSSRARTCFAVFAFLLGAGGAQAQQQDRKAQEMVRAAVHAELAEDAADHSRWEYRDEYRKAQGEATVFRVVETGKGVLKKKVEENGHSLTPEELQQEDARIVALVNDSARLAKQRKESEQDDRRAESMLRMLPDAFVWSSKSVDGKLATLAFVPSPEFDPPTMESRVFAAMAGEIVVDTGENRIRTIKGQLVDDVKFGYGLFGKMSKGGTFDVERRELAPRVWQITESHVHIDGRALLFKTIGEQEDEIKSEFRSVPEETTLEKAAEKLKGVPTSLSARN